MCVAENVVLCALFGVFDEVCPTCAIGILDDCVLRFVERKRPNFWHNWVSIVNVGLVVLKVVSQGFPRVYVHRDDDDLKRDDCRTQHCGGCVLEELVSQFCGAFEVDDVVRVLSFFWRVRYHRRLCYYFRETSLGELNLFGCFNA